MITQEITIEIRCEADLYGYSLWLATHLGLNEIPISRRGFQHGWYWYKFGKAKDLLHTISAPADGILVQDTDYARGYRSIDIPAFATGLPFMNFVEYSGIDKIINESTREGSLVVPTHSFSGADHSDFVLSQIIWAAEHHENISVLLGGSDSHLMNEVKRYCTNIEIGARNHDASSFSRLASVFSRYENMITTQMGSHVLYGTRCGLNVHMVGNDEIISDEIRGTDKIFFDSKKFDAAKFNYLSSHAYVRELYPELYNGKGSKNGRIAKFSSTQSPEAIAKLLGWPV